MKFNSYKIIHYNSSILRFETFFFLFREKANMKLDLANNLKPHYHIRLLYYKRICLKYSHTHINIYIHGEKNGRKYNKILKLVGCGIMFSFVFFHFFLQCFYKREDCIFRLINQN